LPAAVVPDDDVPREAEARCAGARFEEVAARAVGRGDAPEPWAAGRVDRACGADGRRGAMARFCPFVPSVARHTRRAPPT